MGKSAHTPAVPDPIKTLTTAADLNRINEYTPYGNVEYAKDKKSVSRVLTPEMENLFKGATAIAGGYDPNAPEVVYGGVTPRVNLMQNVPGQATVQTPELTQQSDLTGNVIAGDYIPAPRGIDNEYAQQAYQAATSLMNPVYAQQADRLSQDLANKGLPVAGEAYMNAWGDFNRGQDEAYQRAAFNAIQAGDTRYNQQFAQQQQALGQALEAGLSQQQLLDSGLMSRATFGEQQRQYDTQFGGQEKQRQFNMMAALLGLQPAPQVAPLDVQGAYNAAQQQANLNANARNQKKANMYGTIGSIIGAIPTGGASLFARGIGAALG